MFQIHNRDIKTHDFAKVSYIEEKLEVHGGNESMVEDTRFLEVATRDDKRCQQCQHTHPHT